MYLVRTDDRKSLRRIASTLDAVDDFSHCALGELNTLSLSELHHAASE